MRGPTWRLIVDGPLEGARNMALERAVLAAHEAGDAPPTLRLYGWEVPTVSIGRFQDLSGVDLVACEQRGFDVVRRPTGGRGVLHDDELTYAVIAGVSDGVPRGVAVSYRLLSSALADAYRRLGVPAEITRRPRGPEGSAACYLHATAADLSLGAAKLSGSAQVWQHDSVLQHGSFVRSRDVEAEAAVFGLDAPAARSLAEQTVTLETALGTRPDRDSIVAAVREAFEQTLDVVLEAGTYTPFEERAACGLLEEHRVLRASRNG